MIIVKEAQRLIYNAVKSPIIQAEGLYNKKMPQIGSLFPHAFLPQNLFEHLL